MPPEGCLLTLRFRLWCWSSAKHSQTIYFVTKVFSNRKVPFFFLLFTALKKKSVLAVFCFQNFLSQNEALPQGWSGPCEHFWNGIFSVLIWKFFFPHAIHRYYFHTETHQQTFKGKTWTKELRFHNSGKFWFTQSNILSDLHGTQNLICFLFIYIYIFNLEKYFCTYKSLVNLDLMSPPRSRFSLPAGPPAQAKSRQGLGAACCNSYHWVSPHFKTTFIGFTASSKGKFITAGRSDQNAWSATAMARLER